MATSDELNAKVRCPSCNGTGTVDRDRFVMKECKVCHGEGTIPREND